MGFSAGHFVGAFGSLWGYPFVTSFGYSDINFWVLRVTLWVLWGLVENTLQATFEALQGYKGILYGNFVDTFRSLKGCSFRCHFEVALLGLFKIFTWNNLGAWAVNLWLFLKKITIDDNRILYKSSLIMKLSFTFVIIWFFWDI